MGRTQNLEDVNKFTRLNKTGMHNIHNLQILFDLMDNYCKWERSKLYFGDCFRQVFSKLINWLLWSCLLLPPQWQEVQKHFCCIMARSHSTYAVQTSSFQVIQNIVSPNENIQEKKNKKITARYFCLWLLSKIIREMPVGIVVLVNVKHCTIAIFFM